MLCLKNNSGFTVLESLVTMAVMILLSAACVFVFYSVSKSMQHYHSEIILASEKLSKDDYIRTWADSVTYTYYQPVESAIEPQIEALKKHPYFDGKVVKLVYLYDTKKRIRGIELSYRLTNNNVQTTAALFPFVPVWQEKE